MRAVANAGGRRAAATRSWEHSSSHRQHRRRGCARKMTTLVAKVSAPETSTAAARPLPPPADIVRWGVQKLQRLVLGMDTHSFLPLSLEHCSAEYPPFTFVQSGEAFMATIDSLLAAGKINQKVHAGLTELFTNYRAALVKSPRESNADKEAAMMIASIAERVAVQGFDPYTFPSRHERMLEPFDYYAFGQRYCGNLINFDTSFVGNAEGFRRIRSQLDAGDNVVVMANHQSEADPGVWAWMTQYISSSLATDVRYVAGDRVVLDTFAKPFSMGRNLVCVHSKRHMEDDPELRAEKMKTNQRSVRELSAMFKEGRTLLWIAPSGGRDRIDEESGKYKPGVFDPSAVQLIKRLLEKAGKSNRGHVYPMAMASAEIMPPPRGVQKDLGEERVLNHHGVGISLGDEILEADIPGLSESEDASQVYSDHLYARVKSLYYPLAAAVYGEDGADTSAFEQPWAGKF